MKLNEFHVEDAALTWFGQLGYAVGYGPQIALGGPAAKCLTFVATSGNELEESSVVRRARSS